ETMPKQVVALFSGQKGLSPIPFLGCFYDKIQLT
ncbi:unnamed protein product, partial [marine sediment metagenome]